MTWCLVGSTGTVHVLPESMIFVGRANCEINLLSRSVDKRHSVINFDRLDNSFFIKDMETLNGTFVNDTRIPDQTYISLHQGDSIRFGYDPVTYRFDEVDPNSIRQFKAQDGSTKLEMSEETGNNDLEIDTAEDENKPGEEIEGILQAEDPTTGRYSIRESRCNSSSSQYEQRKTPLENRMMSHGRTTPQKQDYSMTSQPSPLYGQPAWWGQDDEGEDVEHDREVTENGNQLRAHVGAYPSNNKDMDVSSQSNHKQLERPTKLPLNEAERDHNIPVHIYGRHSTDITPTTPGKRPPTPEHTEVTLVSASEKHVGFTIEFNAKDDAPKMSMNESLSEFVPTTVKNKIEGSSRMMEELKAERRKKGLGDDPDSYQSPRASPSAVQKLNIMWANNPGKKGSKTGQGDSRSANNSESGRIDAPKSLTLRSGALHKQPVPSKSSPTKSRSSLGNHTEEHNEHNGDNVSESGTYTIESESQSKEAKEARSKIDEVFGVEESLDAKHGSDEDTDNDVEDGVIQEEAITMETAKTQEMEIGRYGTTNGQESAKLTEKQTFQPRPPASGTSTTPAWVRQWAVLASKDVGSREKSNSQPTDTSPILRDQVGHPNEPMNKSTLPAIQIPAVPPRRSGKRRLPSTPPERGEKLPSHHTSSDDSPRQNGLNIRQSPASAFYSPHNHDNVTNSQHEESGSPPGEMVSGRNPIVSVNKTVSDVGLASAAGAEEDGDFRTEVSMNTEILLKDTETFVKSLELRMRDRQQSTPSPDISDSFNHSHRSFDGDVDTDLDTSCVSLVGTSGASNSRRSNQASLPPSGYQGNRNATDSNANKKDSKDKKGGIWNRLSQPARFKQNEKNPPAKTKDSTAASNSLSESVDAAFRRNTNLTGSLPTGRINGRKTPKEAASTETSPKLIRKVKANLSKPRQTRSTMLRKLRFDGKDSPGVEHSDLSPSSSISDMSSSKNPSVFRRSSIQRESNERCQSPKDLHSRTKTANARIDTGRQRTTSRNSEPSPRSEVSLGGQIVQHARAQSMRERRMHAGDTSVRIMSKVQSSSVRTATSTSTRKTSLGSVDSSSVKKAPTGNWRRYKDQPSRPDTVDAYIKSVTSRQSSVSSADESIKSAPAYSYRKPRSNSNPCPPQRAAISVQQLTQHYEEPMRNGNEDVAEASNTLAENLQRLAKGETTLGIAMEHIPKDERMMDEILAEDTVGIAVNETQPAPSDNHRQTLQRSSSLGFNSEGILPQSPKASSPPPAIKRKQWTKPESFDMLVMSSINHLSNKLKDTTDKIAYKLKKLQSPHVSEAELRDSLKDADSTLLKTHNKEIACILRNMRQLEKRLSEIHTMIDPRDEIDVPDQLTPAAQIRRKYISDYGNGASPNSATTGQTLGKVGLGNSTTSETPRSVRSDESEYYV